MMQSKESKTLYGNENLYKVGKGKPLYQVLRTMPLVGFWLLVLLGLAGAEEPNSQIARQIADISHQLAEVENKINHRLTEIVEANQQLNRRLAEIVEANRQFAEDEANSHGNNVILHMVGQRAFFLSAQGSEWKSVQLGVEEQVLHHEASGNVALVVTSMRAIAFSGSRDIIVEVSLLPTGDRDMVEKAIVERNMV